MKKNRGFSLVELIVSIAVMSIVGSLVAVFLVFSTRSYSKTSIETDLQQDAQVTLAQLTNYVIDADQSIEYKVSVDEVTDGTSILSDSLYAGNIADVKMKKLILKRGDELGNVVDTLTWKSSEAAITLSRLITDPTTGSVVSTVTDEVLARNITTFSADLSEVMGKQKVTMSIAFTPHDKNYEATNVVSLRNRLTADLVEHPDEYEDTTSTVLNVKINPATKTLALGAKQTFQAVVYGTNNPSQRVTWSLSGNLSPLTTLNNGVLRIGKNERAGKVFVTATSVQDPTKSATATVTIRSKTKLSLGTIRDYWTYTGYKTYLYVRVGGELQSTIDWAITPANSNVEVHYYPDIHAISFLSNVTGDFTVTISGTVDDEFYTDTCTIHVNAFGEMNDHNTQGKIRIDSNNVLDYWVEAGETIEITANLYDYEPTGSFAEQSKTRVWSTYSTDGLGYNFVPNTSDPYLGSATLTVDENCVNGEIYVVAQVNKYDNTGVVQWYYYDVVTVHVYEKFVYPYIIETTKLHGGQNFYTARRTIRGPVNIVSSTSELPDYSQGIMNLLGSEYTTYTTDGFWRENNSLDGLSYINTSSGNGFLLNGNNIKLNGVIVSENSLTFSAADIQTITDTIIYIKGEHTLQIGWKDSIYDGIIYAPEGTVRLECLSGMFRGIIVAKEVHISEGRGDGMYSILDKDSVMALSNELLNRE